MRFVIKSLKTKKSDPKWKVQLRSYKQEDIEKYGKPGQKSKTVERDLPKHEWERYGFMFNMSLEEAKEKAKQWNAQKKLDDERKARFAREERLKEEALLESAFLPSLLVTKFEEKLLDDSDFSAKEEFLRSKQMSHWRTCKKLITAIEIEIEDWEDKAKHFYKYFIKNNWSLSYSEKLIMMLNRWGKFCSKQQRAYFSEIPFPRGRNKEKIVDNHYESTDTTKESAPLKLSDLEKAKENLKEDQYNWMYVSLWFGLRPSEIDSLIDGEGKTWKLGTQDGVKVFKVYQSKLTGIAKEKRWKLIPCIFNEQLEALKFVKSQKLDRPLVKTIKRHVGEKYTTYAGRKGFETLLHKRSIPYEAISSYLGHASVDRT